MFVLVVDDDDDDFEVFRDALKSSKPDAKCIHAVSGEDALDLLTNVFTVLPDCIFLDINMPAMSGQECLEKIKTDSKLRGISVFVYSTTSNINESEAFKHLGAREFIVKPPKFNELVAALKRVLS